MTGYFVNFVLLFIQSIVVCHHWSGNYVVDRSAGVNAHHGDFARYRRGRFWGPCCVVYCLAWLDSTLPLSSPCCCCRHSKA
jgi:hypothetical protein